MKKILQLLSRKSAQPTNEVPTISSLKSEELWQFIQRPEGTEDAESQATDFLEIWAKAKNSATIAERRAGEGTQEWALNS